MSKTDEQRLEDFLFFDDAAPTQQETSPEPAMRPSKWADSDDEQLTIDISAGARTRKLRKTQAEQTISGADYEARLRSQYQTIHGKQDWAIAKTPLTAASDSEDEEAAELLSSTRSRLKLAPGESAALSFQKLTDVTSKATKRTGPVISLSWAPGASAAVPLLATVSTKDRNLVRVWGVAGAKDHELIASVRAPKRFRVTQAVFISEKLLAIVGPQRGILVFDVDTLKEHTFLTTIAGRSDRKLLGIVAGEKRFAVETENGEVLLVNSETFSLVAALRLNAPLAGWAFFGNSFFCLDKRCGIYRFDRETGKCLQRLTDDQTVAPVSLAVCGSHVLVGSGTGTVDMIRLGEGGVLPEVVNANNSKTFDRLTTSIDALVALPGGEDFIAASKEKDNAIRACFLSTGHTLPAWPRLGDKFGRIGVVAVSGKTVAMGSQSGRVMLFNIRRPLQ